MKTEYTLIDLDSLSHIFQFKETEQFEQFADIVWDLFANKAEITFCSTKKETLDILMDYFSSNQTQSDIKMKFVQFPDGEMKNIYASVFQKLKNKQCDISVFTLNRDMFLLQHLFKSDKTNISVYRLLGNKQIETVKNYHIYIKNVYGFDNVNENSSFQEIEEKILSYQILIDNVTGIGKTKAVKLINLFDNDILNKLSIILQDHEMLSEFSKKDKFIQKIKLEEVMCAKEEFNNLKIHFSADIQPVFQRTLHQTTHF